MSPPAPCTGVVSGCRNQLTVTHDANGDVCEAVLSEEVTVSLLGLKQAWQESYQSEHGTIIVHLDTLAGSSGHSFEYTF